MDGFPAQKNKITKLPYLTSVILLILCVALTSCEAGTLRYKPGQVTKGDDSYGIFYFYVPTKLTEKTEILVLVHGTPKDLTPEEKAELYVASWKDFAEEHAYILIAPAFNQDDFSSRYGDHAMSGYRGLFGREIDADEWVLRLVDMFQQNTGIRREQFSLYGHSAGGQFVGRFLVTHPEVVKRAVITSAATYPQPDIDVQWPFGMGELHADIAWDENTINHVVILPEKEKWLDATKVPLTVIVGMNDTAELPLELIPGQKGKNRFVIARNWVQDMKTFAETNGVESNFKLELIPGIGHSMSGLIPYSQKAILSE